MARRRRRPASVIYARDWDRRVARELTAIIARHGKPGMIVSDYGSEYTCNSVLAWCRDDGVDWHFSALAKAIDFNVSPPCRRGG